MQETKTGSYYAESETKLNKKGFTLIELLVVVAVIGILASVILIGLGGFRGRGRDARRIGDLRQVQNALELYFNTNNQYPNTNNWSTLTSILQGAGIGVTQVPNDPSGSNYFYGTNPPGLNSYVLGAKLEEPNAALSTDVDSTIFGVNCETNGPSERVYCIRI